MAEGVLTGVLELLDGPLPKNFRCVTSQREIAGFSESGAREAKFTRADE